MMGLCHIFLVLFALLFTQFCESRLTHETFKNAIKNNPSNSNVDNDDGTIWAVLVAGSKSYENYRHQADICHAYQILKRGGLSDENIIVFMYDDIAYDPQNPRQGTIINNPNGQDVYQGVPKDYTGENLTANNLLNAILGDQTAITGGTGKVVNSGPNDRIFIYYADHGAPGILSMPNGDDIYAKDFISTLEKKYQMGTYKTMVLRAPKGSIEREEAQKKLEATLTHRDHIDSTFQMMGKALFGDEKGHDMMKTVRSAGKPIVDDWDCFKNMVGTYKTHCGQLSSYGKKHMRAFANMCNAGVQQAQLAKVLSQVCVNKLN